MRRTFNADETGLFYKCLPNKTPALKGDTCTGQKIPKEKISILVAANMDGCSFSSSGNLRDPGA